MRTGGRSAMRVRSRSSRGAFTIASIRTIRATPASWTWHLRLRATTAWWRSVATSRWWRRGGRVFASCSSMCRIAGAGSRFRCSIGRCRTRETLVRRAMASCSVAASRWPASAGSGMRLACAWTRRRPRAKNRLSARWFAASSRAVIDRSFPSGSWARSPIRRCVSTTPRRASSCAGTTLLRTWKCRERRGVSAEAWASRARTAMQPNRIRDSSTRTAASRRGASIRWCTGRGTPAWSAAACWRCGMRRRVCVAARARRRGASSTCSASGRRRPGACCAICYIWG